MSGGFYGKIPTRGDFVRAGLDGPLIDTLDAWMRGCLLETQAALGDDWAASWMEAPVWRCFTPIGDTLWAGIWMPSMDKVERCFPLMILAPADIAGPSWFAQAEAAAFDAVTADLSPDHLALRLRAIPPDPWSPPAEGIWWTDGAPRRAAGRIAATGLPDPARFTSFLTDRAAADPQ
ncbi:type VI secretion system-associated protein TagF [Acidiphilium acidophilum]|uniref:type VI secretion system-associated protein TagF n=1 Tax=Acidiphilium acidophilum TaxID=76588 RepID=UPI002E8E683C|nr:type VI secretion system-associated protein TagF [Acidiphilium acidophilum]